MQKIYIFEGIDGSGKDTQAEIFAESIKAGEIGRLPYYENKTGKIIREYIDAEKKDISEYKFQSLMMANYIEYFEDVVIPHLKTGKSFVMTRCFGSMFAYATYFGIHRSYISHLIMSFLIYLQEMEIEPIEIILDIPVELSLERIGKRKGEVEEVFENTECLTHVRETLLVQQDSIVINGEGTKKEVSEAIHKALIS